MARDQAYSTSRRSFCRASLSILIAPGIALAQGSTRMRRIGILEPGAPETPESIWKQAEPLRELGWVEGQNLNVERRYANNQAEALQQLAEELVRARVEVIVTAGTPATVAAKRVTKTIPIVMRSVADPVGLGLVASLARPGGNVTGFSWQGPEVDSKSLSLLKELLPALQRIGVLTPDAQPDRRRCRTTRASRQRSKRRPTKMPALRALQIAMLATAENPEIEDVVNIRLLIRCRWNRPTTVFVSCRRRERRRPTPCRSAARRNRPSA